jgi:predicted CXXCH cytochrome family protein
MPHARFDHRAHQLATCTSCHAAATSRETSDVLMPSIGVCQQCHKKSDGAEARCFECHAYHDWTKAKPGTTGFDLHQLTTQRAPESSTGAESLFSLRTARPPR